jgi:integrase
MGRKSESGGIHESRGKIRLDIRYHGQRIKPVLDLEWNERNRRAALRLMEEIRTKIRHGVFDPAAYFPDYAGLSRVGVSRPSAPTFEKVAASYLATLTDKAHSTRVSYERALKGYWYPAFGTKPIGCIRASEVHEVLAPLAPKNRNNVLIPCRQTFAFAVADQVLDRSPIDTVKNAKVQKEEPDPFSLDEANAIIADLRVHAGKIVADYFEFAFFSGLRVSEQIALQWRDVDRKRGLVRVRRAKVWGEDKNTTKTHRPRDLELLERAASVLQTQRARTELAGGAIFHNPTTGKPWADEQVQRRYFEASIKRLGLRHRPPKQTRHTFATMCLMAGANPAWVARQLGHASSKMLFEVYSKWIEGADKGLERGKVEAWIGPKLGGQRNSKT